MPARCACSTRPTSAGASGCCRKRRSTRRRLLLSPLYYIRRALEPFADLVEPSSPDLTEAIPQLLEQKPAVIVMGDVGTIPDSMRKPLIDWMENGGTLVRFASSRLLSAGNDEELLPVSLRLGERSLGGALSWTQPQTVGEFPPNGPFSSLPPPSDVTVTRQILAEPTPDLVDRTWATLADGTPLVTGDRRGKGMVVLFHVTPQATWSNLPISGTFVEMLRRIVQLSRNQGAAAGSAEAAAVASLAPYRMISADGALVPPGPEAKPLETGKGVPAVTVENPPGLYGTEEGVFAHNLLPADAALTPDRQAANIGSRPDRALCLRRVARPEGAAAGGCADVHGARQPDRAVADRRVQPPPQDESQAIGGATAAMMALVAAASLLAFAAASVGAGRQAGRRAGDRGDLDDAARLCAHRRSGRRFHQPRRARRPVAVPDREDGARARRSGRRRPRAGRALVLSDHLLADRPERRHAVREARSRHIDEYMKEGGTVLFDTRDQFATGLDDAAASPATERLRDILAHLNVPPLEPVPADHVLTKSFYILPEFPGRFNGSPLWVEASLDAENTDNRPVRTGDGVTPIMITANDFAGAWAVDENGDPMLPTVPSDPMQRVYAYRSGVNIIMYMLTGNYKSDQVHVPDLLQRLGQ